MFGLQHDRNSLKRIQAIDRISALFKRNCYPCVMCVTILSGSQIWKPLNYIKIFGAIDLSIKCLGMDKPTKTRLCNGLVQWKRKQRNWAWNVKISKVSERRHFDWLSLPEPETTLSISIWKYTKMKWNLSSFYILSLFLLLSVLFCSIEIHYYMYMDPVDGQGMKYNCPSLDSTDIESLPRHPRAITGYKPV